MYKFLKLFPPAILFLGFISVCHGYNFGSGIYGQNNYSTTSVLPSISASPSSGTYTSSQSIILNTDNNNYVKYSYSNNLSGCSSGELYSSPLNISTSKTIYAIACDVYGNSTMASFNYVINIRNTSSGGGYVSVKSPEPTPVVINNSIVSSNKNTIRTLKINMKGEDVKLLQTNLRLKGYYNGEIDGGFGPKTKMAVIEFQKANKITADGIVGPKTIEFIGNSENYKLENIETTNILFRVIKLTKPIMKGEDVKLLQTNLKLKGYYNGEIDGGFGPKTKMAVIEFQKANKITADGIVGPKTIKLIK